MSRWPTWRAPEPDDYPTPASCKFISGEDFVALAVKAYLAAGRLLVPAAGEPWRDADGNCWGSARDFHDTLVQELGDRLWRAAIESGHVVYIEEEDPGAGRSPAVEGHGCPAL